MQQEVWLSQCSVIMSALRHMRYAIAICYLAGLLFMEELFNVCIASPHAGCVALIDLSRQCPVAWAVRWWRVCLVSACRICSMMDFSGHSPLACAWQ